MPFLNLALAIDSGDMVSMVAAAAFFIPVYGPIISAVITVLDSIFGGNTPTVSGHTYVDWDANGQILISDFANNEGGAAQSHAWVEGLVGGLQGALASHVDAAGQPLFDLLPGKLPAVVYFREDDGANLDRLHLLFTDASGAMQTRYYDEQGNALTQGAFGEFSPAQGQPTNPDAHPNAQSDFVRDYLAQAQNAIVPAWVAQTARQQFVALNGQAQTLEAQIAALLEQAQPIAPITLVDSDFGHPAADSPDPARYAELSQQIAGLQTQADSLRAQAHGYIYPAPGAGQAQTAAPQADGLHQSLSVLTFTLPGAAAADPASQQAAQPNTALANLDTDAYLERVNWVAPHQALLGMDNNANGRIEAAELLSAGQLDWMDANHDGRIDASDPAFAAIRVWFDANGDADSRTVQGQDETTSLAQAGIAALDLKAPGGPALIRADGSVQAPTAQSLSGELLGVAYSVQAGAAGIVQTAEQADGTGQSVLLAINTQEFNGQAAHMHGGEAVDANTQCRAAIVRH